MWWWNGYGPGPWMFGPFVMIVVLIICGAMMFFMMRGMMGGHRNNLATRLIFSRNALRVARLLKPNTKNSGG